MVGRTAPGLAGRQRLAYPVGAIQKDPSTLEWVWGSIVIGAAILFFIRGPHIARFAAVGMVIGGDQKGSAIVTPIGRVLSRFNVGICSADDDRIP